MNPNALVFEDLQGFFEPLPEIDFDELCLFLMELESKKICNADDLVDEMLLSKYPKCCIGRCVKQKKRQGGFLNKCLSKLTCNGFKFLFRYLRLSACKDQSMMIYGIS